MLATFLLASTLWAASAEERPQEALALVSVEAIADEAAADLAWIVGAHAADLYSTAWSLNRCRDACREGNPLGFSPEARIALKTAYVATTALALWKLRRDGHGRAATLIRWLTVAGHAALVVHNVNSGSKR